METTRVLGFVIPPFVDYKFNSLIFFSAYLLNSSFFIDGKNLLITNFFYLKVFLVIIKVLITTFLMALFCPSVIQPVTIEIKGIGTNLIPPVQEAITINYFSYSMIFPIGILDSNNSLYPLFYRLTVLGNSYIIFLIKSLIFYFLYRHSGL